MKNEIKFTPFQHPIQLTEEQMLAQSEKYLGMIDGRRTVREYSTRAVDRRVIENCIRAASTAPSGAHKQPWHFVIVENPEVKSKIRVEAEKEEHEFYSGRANEEWLAALEPFETNEHKPFLETAPYLIVIFAKNYDLTENGDRSKNYYVQESMGIATGFLISALHQCGLSTLTHTPSPMGFLSKVLKRPKNERAFILLVVGHPADDARVPVLDRKPLSEVATVV